MFQIGLSKEAAVNNWGKALLIWIALSEMQDEYLWIAAGRSIGKPLRLLTVEPNYYEQNLFPVWANQHYEIERDKILFQVTKKLEGQELKGVNQRLVNNLSRFNNIKAKRRRFQTYSSKTIFPCRKESNRTKKEKQNIKVESQNLFRAKDALIKQGLILEKKGKNTTRTAGVMLTITGLTVTNEILHDYDLRIIDVCDELQCLHSILDWVNYAERRGRKTKGS